MCVSEVRVGHVPREDSEAEDDRLTLKARSESLSSVLLLWELPGDKEEIGRAHV